MRHFITGLQFLTRLRLIEEKEWSAKNFSGSVKFFPLVGATLGILFALYTYLILEYLPTLGIHISEVIYATTMIFLWVFFTGALHCDGFMDTMDGIFSGRDREKMLVIMKDSRIGANGIVGFVLLVLFKWSLFFEIAQTNQIVTTVFLMPVIARFMMVIGITTFPYARREGLGRYFAEYVTKKTLWIAFIFTIFLVLPFGIKAYFSLVITGLFTIFFCRYVTRLLGGLTGDVYGAITELSEVIVLLAFLK